MNKHLSLAELQAMEAKKPPILMTMRDRRRRAIDVLMTREVFTILAGYENMGISSRPRATCGVFQKLAGDPLLKEAGLKGSTVGNIKEFLELSDDQIHTMFCYCNYHMDMAVEGHQVARVMKHYL